jgi:hypothetical protein
VRGEPGHELCWRARSHDEDGLVSSWAFACTKLADDDTALSRSEGWSTVHGDRYYLGAASQATQRGATLSLTVATGGLGILATTCPSCGTIRLYVDGQPYDTISLRSSTTRDRQTVYWSDHGEAGFYGPDDESRSTIMIKVVSEGRPVTIDGLVLDRCPGCS